MFTYIARNTRNGKFYIGSSKNFEARKEEHLKKAPLYPFHRALAQNPDDFEWEVIEDESEGRELEQALLDMWFGTEQCYNLNPRAVGGFTFEPTDYRWITNGEEERYIHKEFKCPRGWEYGRLPLEQATRDKMTQRLLERANNPFKKKGEESMAHGRVWVTNADKTEEKYLKKGEEAPEGWQPGRKTRPPRSAESRAKTAAALKGREKTQEHKDKLQEAAIKQWERQKGKTQGD
jgi:predicted GIY-YIG superfamily endonuclease